MDYVTHVEELLHSLLSKEKPNYGYVEKFTFVEEVIKSFLYLEVSDEELIERAKEFLNEIK
jgi:hypothetical protein